MGQLKCFKQLARGLRFGLTGDHLQTNGHVSDHRIDGSFCRWLHPWHLSRIFWASGVIAFEVLSSYYCTISMRSNWTMQAKDLRLHHYRPMHYRQRLVIFLIVCEIQTLTLRFRLILSVSWLYILDFPQLQIAEPLVMILPRGNTAADAHDLPDGAFADFLKSSAHRSEGNVLRVLF